MDFLKIFFLIRGYLEKFHWAHSKREQQVVVLNGNFQETSSTWVELRWFLWPVEEDWPGKSWSAAAQVGFWQTKSVNEALLKLTGSLIEQGTQGWTPVLKRCASGDIGWIEKNKIVLLWRDGVRKAKAQLEDDIKGNTNIFCQCLSSKSNKETVGMLLNEKDLIQLQWLWRRWKLSVFFCLLHWQCLLNLWA